MHPFKKRVPTVLQLEFVECGAACLGMVLGYYGRHEPLDALRLACGVSRDGARAANILRAARSFGLNAKGMRMEPAAVARIRRPIIVYWEFKHYIVVEGFSRGQFYVNDPAMGRRTINEAEFDRGFTGIALTFEPGPDFKKGGRRQRIWRPLWRFTEGLKTAFPFLVLVTTALMAPTIVVPGLSRVFVDSILVDGQTTWLRPLLIAFALSTLLIALLTALQQAAFLRFSQALAIAASSRFFWRVLQLPIEFFSRRQSADIATRLTLNDRLATMLSSELATNVVNVLLAAAYATLMFYYDTVLGAIGLFFGLLNLVALRYAAATRTRSYARLAQELSKLAGVTTGNLSAIETLKASGRESAAFTAMTGQYAKALVAEQRLESATRTTAVIPTLVSMLAVAAVLSVGGWRVMDGLMTMGLIIAFRMTLEGFLRPLDRLVKFGGQIQTIAGDVIRLGDVLDHPLDPIAARETVTDDIDRIEGAIELRNVTFGYSPLDPPLVENFSLRVNPGSRVALVGGSGSGKSTIAKLICGLHRPWSGEILVDGRPIEKIPRPLLTQSISFVDQDIFLLEGTMRQNITLWDSTIRESEVTQAARDAAIEDDILARPLGYEAPLDENGRNLSGGQRQRMEIARALAGHPRVLVLDEATSALDPATERKVDENIRRRGATCVIIAHRLSTIRDSDEIIVLDKGRVIERGNHDSLMARDGLYRSLMEIY